MIDIAKHIRIFNADPDDDYVSKRSAAIKGIEDAFKKKVQIDDLLELTNSLANAIDKPGELDSSVIELVEKTLKTESPSFVLDGEHLQIVCCALIGVLQYLDNSKPGIRNKLSTTDVLAISLWSALSFQSELIEKPKLEALRSELTTAAQRFVDSSAFVGRTRLEVGDLKQVQIAEGAILGDLSSAIHKMMNPIIEAMKTNTALDREEIDLLWSTLSDWSEIAQKKVSLLTEAQRSILAGIEISTLLRRMPTKAHQSLAMRGCSTDSTLNAQGIREQMGELIDPLSTYLEKYTEIAHFPTVFPFFNILIHGDQGMNGANIERPLSDWTGRAILEGTMLNMSKFLNDGQ